MKKLLIEITLLFLFTAIVPVSGHAAESESNEAGLRLGIQAGPKHEYFHQYEVFGRFSLPWEQRTVSGWGAVPYATASLGILRSGDINGGIGTVGLDLTLDKTGSGFSAVFGINADILSRLHFGYQDFGSYLQYGANAGISYRFPAGIKIGYRIQHISNGHIFYPSGTPNPGLDMHLLEASYAF